MLNDYKMSDTTPKAKCTRTTVFNDEDYIDIGVFPYCGARMTNIIGVKRDQKEELKQFVKDCFQQSFCR